MSTTIVIGEVIVHIEGPVNMSNFYLHDSIKEIWIKNGKRHREDGHALEFFRGGKLWYINGKLHREDGPAAEYSGGRKEWRINDLRHREDGPAVITESGEESWYLKGEEVTKEDVIKPTKDEKVKEAFAKLTIAFNELAAIMNSDE